MDHDSNLFVKKVETFVGKGNVNLNINVMGGVARLAGNKPVIEFVSKHLFDMTVGDLIYRLHDVKGVEGEIGRAHV